MPCSGIHVTTKVLHNRYNVHGCPSPGSPSLWGVSLVTGSTIPHYVELMVITFNIKHSVYKKYDAVLFRITVAYTTARVSYVTEVFGGDETRIDCFLKYVYVCKRVKFTV